MTPSQLACNGTEHGHQRAVIAWCNMAAKYGYDAANDQLCYGKGGEEYCKRQHSQGMPLKPLYWIYAIPNGGERSKSQAAKLKAEGVSAGVPDLCLPVPRGQYYGLYLEMKKQDGVIKKDQLEWLWLLHSQHYAACVAYDWQSACRCIYAYLTGQDLQTWCTWRSQSR